MGCWERGKELRQKELLESEVKGGLPQARLLLLLDVIDNGDDECVSSIAFTTIVNEMGDNTHKQTLFHH